jgi:hypothetical protein
MIKLCTDLDPMYLYRYVHWCTIHFVHITLHIVVNAVALQIVLIWLSVDCQTKLGNDRPFIVLARLSHAVVAVS